MGERDLQSIQSPNDCKAWSWDKLKPRVRNSFGSFYIGTGVQALGSFPALPGTLAGNWREAEQVRL